MPPPLLTVGQFRANLWSGSKNCPRPMCVPNLKIALEALCDYALYKSTFTLHYIYIYITFTFVCEILAHFAALH